MRPWVPLLLVLAGCGDVSLSKVPIDADNDGFDEQIDCDDTHAVVNPDAPELCDGLDNDCDGTVDEDVTDAATWYADADGDTFGDASAPTVACALPVGHAANATDCDDAEAAAYPGNPEVCDGVDNDCDGAVDEDVAELPTWYADADGDGYGDAAGTGVTQCEAPSGTVGDATDCDDENAAIHPDAVEADCADPTDYNCDGSAGYADADGDGAPACEDCDDGDAARSPDLPELCDEADTDEDCDGAADDADASVTGVPTWYRDSDGDGYAAGSGVSLVQCEAPTGYASATGDCDDLDGAVNPGAAEVCDPADTDEDCDGAADDDDASTDPATWTTYYRDRDGDAWGDAGASTTRCDQPPSYVTNAGDCDDAATTISPAATEICDPADVDEDCDGLADDADPSAAAPGTWYADADGDGYGDAGAPVTRCEAPAGYVADASDCDDTDATVSPGEVEVCDGFDVDEDCDGLADDADPDPSGLADWYRDGDADGYGGATPLAACDPPAGYVANDGDCADADATIRPSATEVCDAANTDEDCDGLADDADPSASGGTSWYRDADADGYGTSGVRAVACDLPSGYVADATDCDDTSAAVSPADVEVCDAANVDEDCDGLADDADPSVTGTATWYVDADGDGHGGATTTAACDAGGGYVATSTDCDDARAAVSPSAAETCATAYDDDCDGGANDPGAVGCTSYYTDADADGYGVGSATCMCTATGTTTATLATDCDDTSAAVSPGDTEVCDAANVDEDCDGLADDADASASGATAWYRDADGDGYGSDAASAACDRPSGYVADTTDCDDASAAISPADAEVCDAANVDEDCDGLADDADPSATGEATWYVDADGDGYGDASSSVSACDEPASATTDATDCDDADTTVSPAAPEVCADAADNDCDGTIDESCPLSGTYVVDADYDAVIYGEASSEYFGLKVGGDFDFDGDGQDDLAVGVQYGATAPYGYGSAFLYAGPLSAGEAQADDDDYERIYGTSAYDAVGVYVFPLNDLDEDGDDELLVGYSTGARTRLFLGPLTGGGATAPITDGTDVLPASAVTNAKSAGHSNSLTGPNDWIRGIPGNSSSRGLVYVYSGYNTVVGTFTGEAAQNEAGQDVAGGGDADGDGYDDYWIGAPAYDTSVLNVGAVYLVYAPVSASATTGLASADVKIRGAASNDSVGSAVDVTGDVDGDGRDDVLVGAEYDDAGGTDAGAVYLFSSDFPSSSFVASTATAEATIYGASAGDQLGLSRIPLTSGDVDGDGEIDVMVCSQYDSTYGGSSGACWLLYGPVTGTHDLGDPADYDARFVGSDAGDAAGPGGILGDLDGDGNDDIAIGAMRGDVPGFLNYGTVSLFFGG